MNDKTNTRISKFSLIELLVCVAIIALLAGLLLPSLKKARDKGIELYCHNNLKQIGTAFTLYLGDYNGYYPSYGLATSDPNYVIGSCWDGKIAPYLGLKIDVSRANTVFWCPSAVKTVSTQHRSYAAHRGMGASDGFSYCFFRDNKTPRRLSDFAIVYEVPSYVLFAGANNGEYDIARNNGGITVYRHQAGTVILFGDYHVSRYGLIDCQNHNWWFQ